MTNQLGLFAAPDPDPNPVATYTRYSMKHRRHACTRCLAACHAAAKAGTPRPDTHPVAWRRQCGKLVELLCYPHKGEAHRADDTAGRLAKPAPGRRGRRVTA